MRHNRSRIEKRLAHLEAIRRGRTGIPSVADEVCWIRRNSHLLGDRSKQDALAHLINLFEDSGCGQMADQQLIELEALLLELQRLRLLAD